MPGWLINLAGSKKDELKFVRLYSENGVYGTRFRKTIDSAWRESQEKTIADYTLVEEGDLVFFFRERNIYGIGLVKGFDTPRGRQVVFNIFPQAVIPDSPSYRSEDYLWKEQFDEKLWSEQERMGYELRFVFFFDPCPVFFKDGLDMDFVLQSDAKNVANQIRAFEDRSFIRLEDEEARLLVELFTRRRSRSQGIFDFQGSAHEGISRIVTDSAAYDFNPDTLISRFAERGLLRRESMMQIAFAYGIAHQNEPFSGVFGNWDFIANQFPVSPFKPTKYRDFADIFGYTCKKLNGRLPDAISGFYVVELKRNRLVGQTENTFTEACRYIDQTMKYVDWVANYRAGGDYMLIKAFLVSGGFSDRIIEYAKKNRIRDFVIPRRPYEAMRWEGLSLIQYSFDEDGFHLIEALG